MLLLYAALVKLDPIKAYICVADGYAIVGQIVSRQDESYAQCSWVQGDQDHFLCKEMLLSPSILKLHKNP